MKIKSKVLKKAMLVVKKHSPEILMVAGAVGAVTSTVLACKATLKVNEVLDEAKETLEKIHEVQADEELSKKYSEKDAKKDLTIVYVQTGLKLAKLYAPAVILGTLSLTSIFTSNNLLRKRNMALATAYATLDKAYTTYRKRVVDRFGEEVDKELLYGTRKEKIDEEVTDEETGKTKKVKKIIDISSIDGCSPYAIYFDKFSSLYCEGTDDYIDFFLRGTQNHLNDILGVKGVLTLNDVLESLGITWGKEYDRIKKAGMVVGWKYERDNAIGDNKVIFTIIKTHRELPDGSIVPTRIIDFNVDGNIYNRM